MTRFNSQEDVDAYVVEYRAKMGLDHPGEKEIPDEGPESVLQGKIAEYCKAHGYPYL